MWKIYFQFKYTMYAECGNLLSIQVYPVYGKNTFDSSIYAKCEQSISFDLSNAECGQSTFDSSMFRVSGFLEQKGSQRSSKTVWNWFTEVVSNMERSRQEARRTHDRDYKRNSQIAKRQIARISKDGMDETPDAHAHTRYI